MGFGPSSVWGNEWNKPVFKSIDNIDAGDPNEWLKHLEQLNNSLDKGKKIDSAGKPIPEAPTHQKIYEDYTNKTQAAQVKPQDMTKQWEDYKAAQTKTTSDYTKKMEEYLPQNMEVYKKALEKSQAAEEAYSNRVAGQYGVMESAQSSLAKAMEAAQQAANAERQAATDFFNNEVKGRFTSAMEKASQEYAATKADVKARMAATDGYYQNTIKPAYAKLMEGGLSLRDASDPSNYVSQGVQNAYEKLVQKSQSEADMLAAQTKKGGQADYGVLAALGAQARGNVQQPMMGYQTQLAEQASQNQASQAYQTAMRRVASIEDQQRAYAQQARQTGLESGMNQSWRNYDAYGRSTQAAQGADIANYNAMLAGDTTLGNLISQDASTQFSGTQGLSNARQGLTAGNLNAISTGMNAASSGASGIGNLAGQISGLAGSEFNNAQQIAALQRATADDTLSKQMILPGLAYQQASGFNQGDYGVKQGATYLGSQNAQTLANLGFAGQMENFQMNRSDTQRAQDMELAKKAMEANMQWQKEQAEAQKSSSMWGSILGALGTVGGGVGGYILTGGNPLGAMGGASIGGGLMGSLGGGLAGNGSYTGNNLVNPYAMQAFSQAYGKVAPPQSNTNAVIGMTQPQLNPYWQQQTPAAQPIGVSPTMRLNALSNEGLNLAQQQYNLGIDPSLMYSPYSRYSVGNNLAFSR